MSKKGVPKTKIKMDGYYWGLVATEKSSRVLKTLRKIYYSDRKYRIISNKDGKGLYVRDRAYPKKKKR